MPRTRTKLNRVVKCHMLEVSEMLQTLGEDPDFDASLYLDLLEPIRDKTFELVNRMVDIKFGRSSGAVN